MIGRLSIHPSGSGKQGGCTLNDGLRITVLGAGYLGITHAASMASLGFNVLAVDTDRAKVDQLNAGHLPISSLVLGTCCGPG